MNHDGYKTQHLRSMLKRFVVFDANFAFVDSFEESALKKHISETGSMCTIVSSRSKSKHQRYMLILTEVMNAVNNASEKGYYMSLLKNVPRYSSLDELEMLLTIFGR